jgi:hypothetical protein
MVKRMLLLPLTFFSIIVPPNLFAKAHTCKITISGADLKAPIVITEPGVLENFNVWSGVGTSSTSGGVTRQGSRGFIIDWPLGSVTQRPRGLSSYEVSFYAKLPEERIIYVVRYEYDPASGKGFVYLPGKTDKWYRTNVSSILRGVEGKWFFSNAEWERFASSLINEAKPKRPLKIPAA